MAAGRPKGSNKAKLMTDALILALHREAQTEEGPTRKLAVIADQLVERAMEGDVQAIREVFDRVDGKAHQSVDLDANMVGELKITWQTPSAS